ncbi:Plasmodium exported protein, unknown function [Plasmodium relictum]|uniref:Uncharacterized protein n=1 Tax=Plasmodium relictum TaxID=85471 RepID=A0A1J1GK22_PLARL|nr:Plasmodium exported protein, unknown function [Plasmodium relictum]CRG84561.1 Plasmodium exported protein, unknown function [Plasmodium relictum]
MKSYDKISCNIPEIAFISRNVIINKYINNSFKGLNNVTKNRDSICHILYRLIVISIIAFLYIYLQCSYELKENVARELHFSEYHSRILVQQKSNNARSVNRYNIVKALFKKIEDDYKNHKSNIIMGMIFGMKSELMDSPSLRDYPLDLKYFLWLKWSDYLNMLISSLESKEHREFDEIERSGHSNTRALSLSKRLIKELIY